MSGMNCEGNCGEHVGEIHRVRVWHGAKDWGQFNYCEKAIKTDAKRGMLVEVVEPGPTFRGEDSTA